MRLNYLILLATVTVVVLAGCGGNKSASLKPNPAEQAAFDQAAPELKQAWTGALTAAGTNGYVAAQTLLNKLSSQQLSDQERGAVEKEKAALNQHFNDALQKKDPAALQAATQMTDLIHQGAAHRRVPPAHQ